MRISLLPLCAIMASLLVANAVGSSSFPVVKPDPQAIAVASKWLSAVDSGHYSQSIVMLPSRIRSGGETSDKSWLGFLRARRAPLGRPLSRAFVKAQFSRTLDGAPDGNYEFLTYRTSFERKAQTIERVTLTKESGRWQVSGYHFK